MPHLPSRARRDALVLDRLQLAWAAGLFDGEGSTYVYEPRPGYLRLVVSVGQLGRDEPPEVLWRFKAAMLELGVIERQNSYGMWCWRAQSAEECQAAIGLVWRELGSVKRSQAADAIRRVHAQYGARGLKARRPRRPAWATAHVLTSATQPTADDVDRAWASGFLDGEGHFGTPRAQKRKKGPDWHRIRATATQKGPPGQPAEVLFRLQRILQGRIERHGDGDAFRWAIEGVQRVEAIYERTKPWLGTVKQEQARSAVERFRTQGRLQGSATRCARGHAYSRVYLSSSGPKHKCNACDRILRRTKRAAQGIRPRPFKNVARRYTF